MWGRLFIYLKHLIMNCSEGNDLICLVAFYGRHDNCIHLHPFWAFELPNSFSFFSLAFWLWLEVSDASFSLSESSIRSSPICSTAEEVLFQPGVYTWPMASQLVPNVTVMLIFPLVKEFGCIFLWSHCLESALEMGISFTAVVYGACLCTYPPHWFCWPWCMHIGATHPLLASMHLVFPSWHLISVSLGSDTRNLTRTNSNL